MSSICDGCDYKTESLECTNPQAKQAVGTLTTNIKERIWNGEEYSFLINPYGKNCSKRNQSGLAEQVTTID